jgi:P27 family predicted phage terminase small subunit
MAKLTVIEGKSAADCLKPPPTLGKTGLSLWNRVQQEYAISDVGGLETLFQTCAAADRAGELSAQIDRDGAVIRTPNGSLREHPALRGEMAARSFICRTLARLGITLEPLKPVGRPPGAFGWDGES